MSNTADLLELELTARTTLDAVCDRCGKAFLQDKTVPCCLPIGGRAPETRTTTRSSCWRMGEVDVGDLARTAFILGMDTKTLCSEDCKGTVPPVRCRPEPRPLLLREGRRIPVWRSWPSFLENRENDMNKAGGRLPAAFERSRRCHNGST